MMVIETGNFEIKHAYERNFYVIVCAKIFIAIIIFNCLCIYFSASDDYFDFDFFPLFFKVSPTRFLFQTWLLRISPM